MTSISWQAFLAPDLTSYEDAVAYQAIAEQEWPGYPPPPVDPKWWRTPFACIVGKNEEGKVVGGCHWIRREIEVSDRTHVIAALGGVVMAPQYRGRGLGAGMIPFANEIVATAGYEWAVLFTSPERRRFYRAAGYRQLEGEIYVTRFDIRTQLERETVVMAAPLAESVVSDWPNWQHATIYVGHGTW